MINNNNVFLAGQIKDIQFFYEYKGNSFYKAFLEVKRNSPKLDIIPIVLNEYLILNQQISDGDFVTCDGEVRTNNYISKESISEKLKKAEKIITKVADSYIGNKNNDDFKNLIKSEISSTIQKLKSKWDSTQPKSKLFIYCFIKDLKKTIKCEAESIVDRNLAILEGYICKEVSFRTTSKGRLLCSTILANNRDWYKTNYIPIIAWGKDAELMNECKVGDMVKISGLFHSREYDLVEKKIAYEISSTMFSKINTVERKEYIDARNNTKRNIE